MITLISSTPWIRLLVSFALFVCVVAVSFVATVYLNRRMTVRGELRDLKADGRNALEVRETLSSRRDDAWQKLVDRIERAGLSLVDTKADVLRSKLKAAGFDSPAAPRLYTLIRLALVVVLPTVYVGSSIALGKDLSFFDLYVFGSIAAFLGLYLPALFVRAKADRRTEAIVNGFPSCLDLMLVCVEAGLGLEAAMDRVGREMVVSHPLAAKLLTMATLRLRAGASREDALRQMASDASVDEIKSFSTLLIQSDKLGSSISSTLRVYASEMRERRRMRAEERAHRLPVLISIPLVVCMLPVMIGVLMLPAIIMAMRQIFPAMSGG